MKGIGETSVLGARSRTHDDSIDTLEISYTEVIHLNEGRTPAYIGFYVDEKGPILRKHMQEGLFPGCTTPRISSTANLRSRGHHTIRIIALEKLKPLTTLKGSQFVGSWLGVVKEHASLWSRGLEYGDPSLWNTMQSDKYNCGVLLDYDLSIRADLPRTLEGADRTGPIPIMAIEVLSS
ncbi:hypothetical protein H0H81_011357 [Sphagnurus paluster]|uniref:Uncharacterized protein n=1 Tax=Sphagnurus paluster TaxID=117069 RepID=A0A9P7K6B1_9AGAR|nr:hypothetical protein H0H81_011357 [Sphagnurus paluster]